MSRGVTSVGVSGEASPSAYTLKVRRGSKYRKAKKGDPRGGKEGKRKKKRGIGEEKKEI